MRTTCFALMIALLLLLTGTFAGVIAQEAGQPTLAPPENKAATAQAPQVEKADSKNASEEKADSKKTSEEKADGTSKPEAIDVDELLRQLETVIRDPFSPDRAITREQRKANNEFVEVASPASLPTLELVCYAERHVEGKEEVERLVGIKIEGRVYFVRRDDQVTLPRTAGNLVIKISSIEKGFVEVMVGTLQESIIVR